MDLKKFVRMWTEENYNNYDLVGIVSNYGTRAIFGFSVKEAVAYAKNFHAEFYLKECEMGDLAEKGYVFYVEQNGLDRLLEKIEIEFAEADVNMRRLLFLDLSKLDAKELFHEYLNYVKSYGSLMRSYIATQPHYISKIEDELRAGLAAFTDNNEEAFNILTGPDVEFVYLKKGEFFQKSFAELVGEEDAKIDKTLLDTPLYKTEEKSREKKEALIMEKSIPNDVVRLGDMLARIGSVRLKMRFVWMPVVYFLELFLIELKRRYRIPKNTLKKYDEGEIDELILTGRKVSEAVLEERLKGFAKVLKDGEVMTLTGEEANKFMADIKDLKGEISELTGNIASKGVVRGKVILLSYTQSHNHAEKINNMSEGDVIVSEMTRPNIMMACEKAGAIVTDEGGITCHAAIVARELKIPCIIGTKIATQVLRDGDLVEVDADNGVVRIIEKSKS